MNKQYLYLAIVLVILVVFFSASPIYFVQSGQKAVIKRFGIVGQEVVDAGMHIKAPFIDKAIFVSVVPQNIAEETVTYTKDNQPIDVKYNVIFNNPENDVANTVIRYNGLPYETFAQVKIIDAFKATAGKYTASEFVTEREVIRKDFLDLARQSVINQIDNKPVINILDTPIANVDFDDQYETAIKNKQVEQQRAQQKEYELQGARKEAEITVTVAKAEAEALTVKAQAIAKSPQIVRLEEIKKWDGKFPLNAKVIGGGATIVDTK